MGLLFTKEAPPVTSFVAFMLSKEAAMLQMRGETLKTTTTLIRPVHHNCYLYVLNQWNCHETNNHELPGITLLMCWYQNWGNQISVNMTLPFAVGSFTSFTNREIPEAGKPWAYSFEQYHIDIR